MRRFELSLIVVLAAGCSTPANPPQCDLRELIPMSGGFTVDPQTREVREAPDSPILVPCECEIDPRLRAISARDPVADANASFESGEPHFLGEPLLGGVWPIGFEESDYAILKSGELELLPGLTEEIWCYEHTRLSLVARTYLELYNRELLRLVRAH